MGFFALFGNGGGEDDCTTSSKLFFRGKNNVGGKGQNRSTGGSGSRMLLYQGKKAESSFSELEMAEAEMAEAAFHLTGAGRSFPSEKTREKGTMELLLLMAWIS